ncbi:DUF1097 domain-containing protein [uncultured Ruegeria sp.]|uniref:DUF1097 domain-containing protein n=1 Tax=uncultured Ruegeria sp. TaxID=259304 RepID=UPI00263543CC|nr:DUF1097 domain-containing protein [uncultured Ruegeria sp.]
MTQLNSMALALAICGALATFSFMQFGGSLSLWAAFVAWASFFHSGGQISNVRSTLAAALFGTALGGITMYLITGTPVGGILGVPVWAAVVVFVSAGIAVLTSRFAILAAVPITMHALACVAAFVILNEAGGPALLSGSIDTNAILNIGLSMAIGVGFAVATATLAGVFAKSEDTQSA